MTSFDKLCVSRFFKLTSICNNSLLSFARTPISLRITSRLVTSRIRTNLTTLCKSRQHQKLRFSRVRPEKAMGSLYGHFKAVGDGLSKLLEVAQSSTTFPEQNLQLSDKQVQPATGRISSLSVSDKGIVREESNVVSSSRQKSSVKEKQQFEGEVQQQEQDVLGCLLDLSGTDKITKGMQQKGVRHRSDTYQIREQIQKRKQCSEVVQSNQRKPKRKKQRRDYNNIDNSLCAVDQWRKIVNSQVELYGNIYESAFGSYLGEEHHQQQTQSTIWKANQNKFGRRTSFHVQMGSSQIQNGRKYMEDRHICVPNLRLPSHTQDSVYAYAGVFDGHNGGHTADIGVQGIFENIVNCNILSCFDGYELSREEVEQISRSMKNLFFEVDNQIINLCMENEWRGGSTALTALFIGQQMFIANCGDSRAVLCNSGTALRITTDHKPNLFKERERIEANGGEIVCQSNRNYRVAISVQGGMMSGLSLSRALGDYQFKCPKRLIECEPDIHHRKIENGDQFLILATDGLWDTVSDQQAVNIVQDVLQNQYLHMSMQQRLELAAEECQNAAVTNGSVDNITVVVISFCRE